jgi:hypothetical protein
VRGKKEETTKKVVAGYSFFVGHREPLSFSSAALRQSGKKIKTDKTQAMSEMDSRLF